MNPRRHPVAIGLALCLIVSAAYVVVGRRYLFGPILPLAIGFVFIWMVIAIPMLLRSKGRPERIARLVIWVPTLLVCGFALRFIEGPARELAPHAVSTIESHKARTGAFPATLNDAGLDPIDLRKRIGLNYDVSSTGAVTLTYSSPSIILASHQYDFISKRWTRLD